MLKRLLLVRGILDILEGHRFLRLDRRIQSIHCIVDGFVGRLDLAVHKKVPFQLGALMRACQRGYFADELPALIR